MLTHCFEPDHEMRDVQVDNIICNRCQHKGEGITCKAFPDGIPMEILRSGQHFSPVPGDHGIVFEQK